MWQTLRYHREPFESEINDEIEEQYQLLEAEKHNTVADEDDDDDVEDFDTRMGELQTRMDASTQKLEAKINASNGRLESKIDDSNQRMEAMFRQLLSAKALHMEPALPQSSDVPVPFTPVSLQVAFKHDAMQETTRLPSPNNGASGMSDRNRKEDVDVVAAKDVEGGASVEEAEGGPSEETDAAIGTSPVLNVADEVHEEEADPNVETAASTEQTQHPVQREQVNSE